MYNRPAVGRILHIQSDTGGKRWNWSRTVPQLFRGFMKAYDFVMREVLHRILIESIIPVKLVRLIKMCSS